MLKCGDEEGKKEQVCVHKHLCDLTHTQTMTALNYDLIVKAILDGDVANELEDVEITGGDLLGINLIKLEDWWGIKDPNRR